MNVVVSHVHYKCRELIFSPFFFTYLVGLNHSLCKYANANTVARKLNIIVSND